jgi:hypothetical protein
MCATTGRTAEDLRNGYVQHDDRGREGHVLTRALSLGSMCLVDATSAFRVTAYDVVRRDAEGRVPTLTPIRRRAEPVPRQSTDRTPRG